uniref:Uncharacterized protein n=1 Tax=Avena sativa TaxID=4498 RepID=A0ACD5XER4_AVESA
MGCTVSHDALAAAARRATGLAATTSRREKAARDPAAVCRERAALIRAAANRRFAFSAAHAAYFRSLGAVGGAVRRFAAAALLPSSAADPDSPVLTLPPSPAKPVARTASSSLPPSPSGSSSTVSPLSHSLSDHEDDTDDEEDLHALDHSRRFRHWSAPPHQPQPQPPWHQQQRHYMRNTATVPNVVYEDPYAGYAEAHTGYGYGYPYGPRGEVLADERRPPPPTPPPPEPEASGWDFLDPFLPYDHFLEEYATGGITRNLPTNSPNYAELRRMEGIPELEDEAELEPKAAAASKASTSAVGDQNVKGKRPVPTTNAASKGESSEAKVQSQGSSGPKGGEPSEVKLQSQGSSGPKGGEPSEVKLQSKRSTGANGEAEKPVSMPSNASSKSKKGARSDTVSLKGMGSGDIDGGSSTGKKGVAFDDDDDESIINANGEGGSNSKSLTVSSGSFSPLHNGDKDVMEAMEEIKATFEQAVGCGDEVSKLLEVGKVPHRTTPGVLRYFSSSLTVSSSYCLPKRQRNSRLPSSRASMSASSPNGRRDPDLNLSSTLEKLCAWEQKLYQEVKAEEKLRILYEKNFKRLESLDNQGAEQSEIDSTRLSVRDLKSRISINIRTANAFSSKIEKIRDEELYPQLVDLIKGLRRMWKAVLECHKKQLSAIRDSRIHLLKARTISQSSAAAKATLELERELTKWYRCFNKWISTQRSYVEALNGWLRKWFPEVQELDAPDGAPPFSPGKLGARPIFVITNDWFRAIELVPKNDTLKSIEYFSNLVHELRRSQVHEHRQRKRANLASKDYSRRREVLQRELGVDTGTDMIAFLEQAPPGHGDDLIYLRKMRKRQEDERARHHEVVKHVHLAAAATLPVGFVPLLEQMVSFFQGNLQVYGRIRTNGTHLGSSATHVG